MKLCGPGAVAAGVGVGEVRTGVEEDSRGSPVAAWPPGHSSKVGSPPDIWNRDKPTNRSQFPTEPKHFPTEPRSITSGGGEW